MFLDRPLNQVKGGHCILFIRWETFGERLLLVGSGAGGQETWPSPAWRLIQRLIWTHSPPSTTKSSTPPPSSASTPQIHSHHLSDTQLHQTVPRQKFFFISGKFRFSNGVNSNQVTANPIHFFQKTEKAKLENHFRTKFEQKSAWKISLDWAGEDYPEVSAA